MSTLYMFLFGICAGGGLVGLFMVWKYATAGHFQIAGYELLHAFILGVLALLLSAESARAGTLDLEISLGANLSDKLSGRADNSDGGFTGPRDLIEFALRWETDDRKWFVAFSHISHLSCGFPFGACKPDQAFGTIDGFAVPQEAFIDRLMFGRRFRLIGGR